jgi:predicted RND superfamily exporter protein
MMFFSILGLVASYLFSRMILIDDHISVKMDFTLRKSKWHAITILAALVGIFHLAFFKIDTSITRFNFTPPHIKNAQTWFYSQVKTEKIFFKIYEKDSWNEINNDFKKSKLRSIRAESIYSYIPSLTTQSENLASWISFRDSFPKMPEVEKKVFAPFLENLNEVNSKDVVDLKHPPEYLSHLATGDRVVNLWFAKGPEQEKALHDNVYGVESLVDIFMNFTTLLTREVTIFMPITLIAIWLLLFFRYMSVKKSLICLVPFLFSLGLYGLFHRYLHFPLSFMSLLGLFLIYGLSVDYGIFSTDYFTNAEKDIEHESSLNLSLLVNWISGIVGFLPLLWCKHPILSDLGLVLIVGMIGIFYATFFIVPALFLLRGTK